MGIIEDAIRVARKYYDEKTFYHAMRVAAYVTEDNLIPNGNLENCVVLAILHDLLEDTDFKTPNMFGYYIANCLEIITKKKEDTYDKYLKNIKRMYVSRPEAYWVKLADIKDHLCQTETLTDELKDKYVRALPNLL